jgi:predicted nuclease of predicted toxin-antitoxin system
MRIKLDENLPARLKNVLTQHGYDADTVAEEGLAGHADGEVWQAAQNTNRFLITQDMDFSDIRLFTPGNHEGILLVRLREPGANALVAKLSAIAGEIRNWHGCFVVLTEHKLRIKRPSATQ